MRGSVQNILETIGNTPIIGLHRVAADVKAQIFVKLESANPGGSIKDRVALRIVDAAERSGALQKGGTIIEATSGNTGMGLALVAAVRGYQCIFVMPDKMSQEKIDALRAFGARVVVCPTAVEPEDPRSYYSVAKRLVEETANSFYANQYHNPENPAAHYHSTAPEIWEQTGGEFDVFCAGMGTGGTITGCAKYFKEHNPNVKIVGVDPVGSLYYDYFKTGKMTQAFSYYVEGIGEDFLPSTMDLKMLDDVVRVDDGECFTMTRRLAREEGLFVGGSCGAAVAGAIKYAERTGTDARILVVLPDNAYKYLSKIFNDEWLQQKGFMDEEDRLGRVSDILLAQGSSGVIAAQREDDVASVINKMKEHSISQLPVLDGEQMAGLIAEADLLGHLSQGGKLQDTIASLVESEYTSVSPRTQVAIAKNALLTARMVVVLDAGKLAGVVTKIDLIEYLASKAG